MFKSIGSYLEVKNHFIPFELHFLLGGGKTDTLGRETEKIMSLWIPKQSRLWLQPTCPLLSPGVTFSKTSFISWRITYRIYSISLLIWLWELFLFNGRDESQLTACPFVQIEFVGACNSLLGQKKTQEEKERYSEKTYTYVKRYKRHNINVNKLRTVIINFRDF